jgi:carboxylesterase type B
MLLMLPAPVMTSPALASASTAPPPPPPGDATAQAPAGVFLGTVVNGTRTWRGIPYAEPPIGKRRWRKTVQKARIETPMETKAFGKDCAQLGPGWASLGGMIKDCHDWLHGCPNHTWTETATSEDCLFLNVYAPAVPASQPPPAAGRNSSSALFPVVVYFPSGAFQWGAANDAESNAFGKALAPGWRSTVFVTANYRTGIFGFLASESLSARSGDNSSGLFGIQDQTMVLTWVQENIAAFGGDPQRVMIYGESAGATSMSLHLVMPESKGLVRSSQAFPSWKRSQFD